MPYEREAVAESNSAIPSQPQATFKEERVINPYQSRTGTQPIKPQPEAKVGQSDISNASEGSVVTPSPTEESVTLSPAAAALARKEQAFRQRDVALKEKEKALEERGKKLAELEELDRKLAAKDYSDLAKRVPYDEFTDFIINQENGRDPQAEQFAKLETEIGGLKDTIKKDVDARFEAVKTQRRLAIKELVSKDEAYSTVRELKMEEHVLQHMLDTWEHDNVDLSPEQAAKEVEEILFEKAQRWAGIPKIKGTLPPAAKELPPLKPQLTTLTNNLNSAGEIKRPQKSFQGMSDSERYAEARRRAEEKLKQGK